MLAVAENILELVGQTPVVKLTRLTPQGGASIFLKLESFNPTGSNEDRVALKIASAYEKKGLGRGKTLMVTSTGNLAASLAMVGAIKGFRVKAFVPENYANERVKLAEYFGAEVERTPSDEGMEGAFHRAEAASLSDPEHNILIDAGIEESNPIAHAETTATEILKQMGPGLDMVIVPVESGGTVAGIAPVLKAKNKTLKMVAVEPSESPVVSGGDAASHTSEGFGSGLVTQVLEEKREFVDEVMTVGHAEARETALRLAREEGILTGYAGGAAVWSALQRAKDYDEDAEILVVIPDHADRYFSTDLFA